MNSQWVRIALLMQNHVRQIDSMTVKLNYPPVPRNVALCFQGGDLQLLPLLVLQPKQLQEWLHLPL